MSKVAWSLGGESASFGVGEDFAAWIAQTASGDLDFLILEDDDLPGFVQCAAAGDGLIVEMRSNIDDAVWHLRFIRDDVDQDARLPPEVPGYQGYLVAEILPVDAVVEIFHHYIGHRLPHPNWGTRDILHELG